MQYTIQDLENLVTLNKEVIDNKNLMYLKSEKDINTIYICIAMLHTLSYKYTIEYSYLYFDESFIIYGVDIIIDSLKYKLDLEMYNEYVYINVRYVYIKVRPGNVFSLEMLVYKYAYINGNTLECFLIDSWESILKSIDQGF